MCFLPPSLSSLLLAVLPIWSFVSSTLTLTPECQCVTFLPPARSLCRVALYLTPESLHSRSVNKHQKTTTYPTSRTAFTYSSLCQPSPILLCLFLISPFLVTHLLFITLFSHLLSCTSSTHCSTKPRGIYRSVLPRRHTDRYHTHAHTPESAGPGSLSSPTVSSH